MTIKGINDFVLSLHFNMREFMSPDTCQVMIMPELISKLEDLRAYLNKPIHITSGYRTAERNKAVGGVEDSLHLTGRAADFLVDAPVDEVRRYCNLSGFSFIKYYPEDKHWHVDVRPL